MQQLMIPKSPIVDGRGQITQEWLVFMNELIRLSNQVISSDVVDKAKDSSDLIIEGLRLSSIAMPESDELSTYVAPVIQQDEVIQNTAIQVTHDDQQQDNPYALISSIEQQLYDQQIWGLNA